MPISSTPSGPQAVARIVFVALVGGPVLLGGVAVGLRPDLPAFVGQSAVRYGALAIWLVLMLLTAVVRRGIPEPEPGQRAAAWWRAHLPRVIALWSLVEVVGLVAAMGYFLTGDVLLLGVFLLGFLMPMALLTPGRLEPS